MKKILKAGMRARLNKEYPTIIDISRETGTNNLIIRCQSIAYTRKLKQKEEEIKPHTFFKIACINPNDQKEPHTEETLEKALQEFSTLFNNEIVRIKQIPGFISFSTYNAPLTPDELERDINHVFNFSIYTAENDPVKNSAMIKTAKKYPILPKISKKKKDKPF
ncbi:MAG: hypothetical protein WCB90_02905 [Methanosarcina sp.]